MIRTIHIRAFGPHRDTTVDWSAGSIVASGPSGAGKTAILDALAWCLYGTDRLGQALLPDAAIHRGSKSMEVSITLQSGTALTRRRTRSATHRTITPRDGAATSYRAEKEWRSALRSLGDQDLVLSVLTPGYWLRLAERDRGRPLRDVILHALARAGHPADLRGTIARLMEPHGGLREHDPIEERDALRSQRAANRAADVADGRVQAAREELSRQASAVAPSAPSEEELSQATVTETAAECWAAYSDALADYRHHAELGAARRAAIERWDAEHARLQGSRPDGDPAALRLELGALSHEIETADADEGEYTRAVEVWEQATAARRLWEQQAERWATLREERQRGEAERRREAERSIKAATGAERLRLCRKGDGCPLLLEAIEPLPLPPQPEEALDPGPAPEPPDLPDMGELRERERLLRQAIADHQDWGRQLRLLGDRPAGIDGPVRPPPPSGERPTERDIQEAQAIRDRDRAARLWAESVEQAAGEARVRLERAEAQAEQATVEAVRIRDLVVAIREAPGVMARELLAHLGDLGAVTLELEGTACRVTVDGRPPTTLQSTGRLLLADLHFRLALRRLAGSWLPIVVDQVQDLAGESWPPVPAPVLWLLTRAGELTVGPISGEHTDG